MVFGVNKDSASFLRRLAAFIFDILVINLIIFWPFRDIFTRYFGAGSFATIMDSDYVLGADIYLALLIVSILAMLYFTFFEYYISQTPGKMLFNIMAVSSDGDMTFFKALARNISILPFFPFYIFWIIEPLHLIFYKETLLEKMTATCTVDAKVSARSIYSEYKLNKV